MNPVEYRQLQEVMSERAPDQGHGRTRSPGLGDRSGGVEGTALRGTVHELLVENFEELYDGKCLLDRLKSPVTDADPEFFDLVKAYWAQLKRDRSPLLPVTADADEFKALPKKDAGGDDGPDERNPATPCSTG